MAPFGRPCPVRVCMARGRGRAHESRAAWHERHDPDLSLPPGDRGAGVRHPRLAAPGPLHLRARHRRAPQRRRIRNYMAGQQRAVRTHARGREAGALDRMIEMKVSYDTDRHRAMEDTKIWAALALPGELKANVNDPREMERLAKTAEETAHRRWLVSSEPDEHIDQLRPYLELGFRHLVFHYPGEDQSRFIELYSKQILPRLRKEFDS